MIPPCCEVIVSLSAAIPPTNKRERDTHEDGVGGSVCCDPVVEFHCGYVYMDSRRHCGSIIANTASPVGEGGGDDRDGLDVTERGHTPNGVLFARVVHAI